MKDFFKVTSLENIIKFKNSFPLTNSESVSIGHDLNQALHRIIAQDVVSDIDIPGFDRSTMDGYAVCASSTFGATEAVPVYLNIIGSIEMGEKPNFKILPGQAAKISTGGMLCDGADSVIMIEYTEDIDEKTIEVYKSVAPGQHVITKGEDVKKNKEVLFKGTLLRPQEIGVLAALGYENIEVYKKPIVSIISTGDEIIPINQVPSMGKIRDVNTYTLSNLIIDAGGIPVSYGIVNDNFDALFKTCEKALVDSDILLISGGSSVGMRDFTIDAISALPDSEILAHGVSISPGKPTILAKSQNKQIWGLPGHITSAMVVFSEVVAPFINYVGGLQHNNKIKKISAILDQNLSSAQGRTDFVRVRLYKKDHKLMAKPILGKSGLINTMLNADGLVKIDINNEGLDKGSLIDVKLI